MTLPATEAAPADLLPQLYRYAQDIQELMEQHGRLQARYQSVMQSQGRADIGYDLLLPALRHGNTPCLVTDSNGSITHVNQGAEQLLGESEHHLRGSPILQLAPRSQREVLQAALARLVSPARNAHVELCQFDWFDGDTVDSITTFDVLIAPLQKYDGTEVFWLMNPHQPAVLCDVEKLANFNLLQDSANGFMVMDAHRNICSANLAVTQITGYAAGEVIGSSPHLLSAEQRDGASYQSFWNELISCGSWSGELFNRRKTGKLYPEWKTLKVVKNAEGDTLAFFSAFADSAQKDTSTEQLSQLAYHDSLTGLPNRRLLEDRLAQALGHAQREDSGLSLLFIDLDRFKPINDKLGHETGDLVLKEVARRLRESVRQGDTAARVGGDEFVILLQRTGRRDDVVKVANQVLTKLTRPIVVGADQLLVGASIGCVCFPEDGSDLTTLLKHADSAMYAAKRFGGNHFCFFEPADTLNPFPSLGLELWRALEREELYVLYQPQVTAEGRLRGCEALLRWNHPVMGLIAPLTFIPIAEANGAILLIGDWVLEAACRQLTQWQALGLQGITMSVNVAPRQLHDPGFAQRVSQTLQRTGVAPGLLELEITETEALKSELDGRQALQSLRAMGVKIAVDDFGTGYSSLSRLQSMPIDRLKIDKSFIRDLAGNANARAISQCFVSLGMAMNMEVIAEGVETNEQLQVLTDQGCRLIQGYFTGRPMTGDALLAKFKATNVLSALAPVA